MPSLPSARGVLAVALVCLSLVPLAAGPQGPTAAPDSGRAFYCTSCTTNGAVGRPLAASRARYRWETLNAGRSYLTPSVGTAKLMRDPCVARGPDGIYHMVWTSGWNENNIGYASTRD